MKEFDLQEAKAGKPVCTRDGRNARIICFDVKHEYYPIIALIESEGKEFSASFGKDGRFDDGDKEYVASYCADGRFIYNHRVEHSVDLFMAPEKHVGWVNIYGSERGNRLPSNIFNTEEEAVAIGKDYRTYITTTKIEWEE